MIQLIVCRKGRMIACYPIVRYFVLSVDLYQVIRCFSGGEKLVIERARTYFQTLGVCANSPVESFQELCRASPSAIGMFDSIRSPQ